MNDLLAGESIVQEFRVGDRVNWTPGGARGFGWLSAPVAGVVEALGKRITIRVARRAGRAWTIERKHVAKHRLSIRESLCPAVDSE